MYSKSTYCNVSKLSDYYKIARSFTLFSLRKYMQDHAVTSFYIVNILGLCLLYCEI